MDDHLGASVQRSPSRSIPTSSVPRSGRRGDGVDSSRRSPSKPIPEIAEQDHGLTEEPIERLSSQGDNHEPVGPAELPRRTQPHGKASQNDSVSINVDGKTAEDGESDSCGDSSDDSDGGNDGDDDDYDDDGGWSDTDDEDGGYSKKRAIDRSPSTSRSDSGYADGPAGSNAKEKPARLYKR